MSTPVRSALSPGVTSSTYAPAPRLSTSASPSGRSMGTSNCRGGRSSSSSSSSSQGASARAGQARVRTA
eukprot:scaffold2555_cov282-Prasinococcus_capsulatus_cf.AAC.1